MALQLSADTKIEAKSNEVYKTLFLLGASLPASFLLPPSFFIAENLQR
jgi:hypothetical protein